MRKRMTTGPVRLGDLQIEAGTPLFTVWAAGNHDPVAIPEPARFDPVRDGARPLIFGMGQYACLGHAIVRAALRELPAVFITKDAGSRATRVRGISLAWEHARDPDHQETAASRSSGPGEDEREGSSA